MLTVNYITRPWFLDISVEFIKEFKHKVNLNVIMIISPATAGYLGISDADAKTYLNKNLPVNEVLKGEVGDRLRPYFEGANVIFKFEQYKESHYKNALGWMRLSRKYRLLKADLTIIEGLSMADWYFLLRLRRKKIYYIIHDPKQHLGEEERRVEIIKKLYFPHIDTFITYSEYSTQEFKQHYPDYAANVLTFKMPVFTLQNLHLKTPAKKAGTKKIVFFGRISPYKGVELFYDAATELTKTNNQLTFIIAGKANEGYDPVFLNGNSYPNIDIRNRFISLKELAEIMNDADLCVLPYFDATQSGVVMTSYAFNLPVLVSDCPGLLEYCLDKENFSFKNQDLQSLISKMQNLIDNEAILENNRKQISDYALQNVSLSNSNIVLNQYSTKK